MKKDFRKKIRKYFVQFSQFFTFFVRQAEKERRTRYKKQEEDREVERQTIRDKVLHYYYVSNFFAIKFFFENIICYIS